MAADSPYGVTLFATKTSPQLSAQQIANLVGMGPGTWLRYQLSWSQIEQTQGVYTWSLLDAVVAQCNANGINLLYPIQNAPNFYNSVDPTTGIDHYPTTNNNWLPNATHFAAFAQAVATRYNGGAQGLINEFQIGNEEWDTANPRDIQSLWYVPIVLATYPLLRSIVGPTPPICLAAVRKTPTLATAHQIAWLSNLYSSLAAAGFRFAGRYKQDAHYYRQIGVGPGPDPTTSDVNVPDIGTVLSTMQTTPALYGFSPDPCINEWGLDVWNSVNDVYATDTLPVTMDQQRLYTMKMYNVGRAKGAKRVLYYTDTADLNTVTATTLPYSAGDSTPTAVLVAQQSKGLSGVVSGVFTQNPAYSDPVHTGLVEYAAGHPAWPGSYGWIGEFHA